MNTPSIVNNYYLGSDYMHTLQILSSLAIVPAVSAVYFVGAFSTGSAQSNVILVNLLFAKQAIEIPRSGTLSRAWLKVAVGELGTLASAEPVAHALRFNDAVDLALPNLAYTARQQSASAEDLNYPVAAGDLVALKVTTPAWATVPSQIGWHCVLFFR